MELHEIYMHTANGLKHYPFAPKPEDIHIDVVAHHLAARGRWNGATQHPEDPMRIFHSVAEHSVDVADFIEFEMDRPDLALEALLHDAAEAFNGDLIRPLKYSEEFAKPFQKVEEHNERAVAQRFGLPYPMSPEIKIADNAVTHAEFQQIVPKNPNMDWSYSMKLNPNDRIANIKIKMLNPYEARELFLDRFHGIMNRQEAA